MNLLSIKRSITPIFQGAEIRSPVTEGMFAEWKLMHNELRSRPKGGLSPTCTPRTLTFCFTQSDMVRFMCVFALLSQITMCRRFFQLHHHVRFRVGDWWWWWLCFHLYFFPADVEFTPTCFMFSLQLYSLDLSRWREDKKNNSNNKNLWYWAFPCVHDGHLNSWALLPISMIQQSQLCICAVKNCVNH